MPRPVKLSATYTNIQLQQAVSRVARDPRPRVLFITEPPVDIEGIRAQLKSLGAAELHLFRGHCLLRS